MLKNIDKQLVFLSFGSPLSLEILFVCGESIPVFLECSFCRCRGFIRVYR